MTEMKRLLILGGPYVGKTTAARKGIVYDPELSENSKWRRLQDEWSKLRDAKADPAAIARAQTAARKEYSDMFSHAIRSDVPIVAGHFSPESYMEGKTAGRDVRIVVLTPEEYKRRFDSSTSDNKASRAEAGVEQLASLVKWLNLDGRMHNPKIFQSVEAAAA
jgi:hypothetical protein